jgi:phosphinothricin acetyltransferase
MIRLATPADAAAVLAIYAPIVVETPISFEWEVPSVAEMASRIRTVLRDRPWLVYERAGELLGYVYASTFRERFAYRWSTEVSVYIHTDARGRGLGRTLYSALFGGLRLQGYCTAIAGATVPNAATESLHASMGFTEIGRFPAAGFKFGQWHDVVFWRLLLRPLPDRPDELIPLNEIIGTEDWNNAIEKQAARF